ncbi:TPA: hypothetical protein JBH27_13170 [Legionella pneumophila]|nr:hypothetical protein [Legionella pneumophila subsp. pneumophila]HAT9701579.1 hypothetical protein [Legionella pneumophila subsp. pneumophila]HAU0823860.1 hypothetical protein [Legionella pneumophila]HAU1190239.1 hypothetical protein [Legionella pneumophila]
MPCVLFSVGRAVHSLLKPGKNRKARSRGQINRFKANDLACTASFLCVFLLDKNKVNEAIKQSFISNPWSNEMT